MTIEYLREFVDLAYTLNYQKTADRMYISHSTLSKHIKAMEKELGDVVLFHRSKHSVELTELGKAFLSKIQKTLSDYDSALAVLQHGKSKISGSISVGFLDDAARELLPPVLEEYRNNYPEMNIELFSGQIGDILKAYLNNQIDVAVMILFPNAVPAASAGIHLLSEESLSVAFPKGHPLESKEKIFIDDLLAYPLILPSRQQFSDYAKLIEDYIENGPEPPNIVCNFTHFDTALIMTEANMGISILPTHISRRQTPIIFRTINDFHPVLNMVVVWNKRRINPGTMEFVEAVLAQAEKMRL